MWISKIQYCVRTLILPKESLKFQFNVNNGQIFSAKDWDESMDYDKFELKGGKLLLDDEDLGETLSFVRKS